MAPGGLACTRLLSLPSQDLITALRAEVVVVSRSYLGSLNHTLLTASELAREDGNVRYQTALANLQLLTGSI